MRLPAAWRGPALGCLGYALTAAFAVLLLEGAAYWAAKLRQLRTRSGRLPGARWFRAARLTNLPPPAHGRHPSRPPPPAATGLHRSHLATDLSR